MRRLFEPIPRNRSTRRWAQLLCGVVLYGVTAAMLVLAGLGLDPWDVLHQGLSRSLGLSIGTWAIIVSFIVVLGWLGLRQHLGVGTLVNAVVVGLVIDLTVSTFDPPRALWARSLLLTGGVVGNGIATRTKPSSDVETGWLDQTHRSTGQSDDSGMGFVEAARHLGSSVRCGPLLRYTLVVAETPRAGEVGFEPTIC